jgi:hypothetical protein
MNDVWMPAMGLEILGSRGFRMPKGTINASGKAQWGEEELFYRLRGRP